MVDRKRIELFPKACKAPVLPLSPTAHLNWMTMTYEYTRISPMFQCLSRQLQSPLPA